MDSKKERKTGLAFSPDSLRRTSLESKVEARLFKLYPILRSLKSE